MAYAKVQSITPANTGGSATPTASFSVTPGVGNLIIVDISSSGPNSIASSVTDNQGNTYTQVGTVETASTSDSIQTFWAVANTSSGTFTVTVHFGGASQGSSTVLGEYSGNAASPFDKQGVNIGSSATPTLAASITPANANSLVHSAVVDANADNTSIAAGTNFTIDQTQLNSSSRERIGTENWIQTTATATTGGFTLGTSAAWALKTSIFIPAATTVTVAPGLSLLGIGS